MNETPTKLKDTFTNFVDTMLYNGMDDEFISVDVPYSLAKIKGFSKPEGFSRCPACTKKFSIRRKRVVCSRCSCAFCRECCGFQIFLGGNVTKWTCCFFCHIAVSGLGITKDILAAMLEVKRVESYDVSVHTVVVAQILCQALKSYNLRTWMKSNDKVVEALGLFLARFLDIKFDKHQHGLNEQVLNEIIRPLFAVVSSLTSPTELEVQDFEATCRLGRDNGYTCFGEATFSRRIKKVIKKGILERSLTLLKGEKVGVDNSDYYQASLLLLVKNCVVSLKLFDCGVGSVDVQIPGGYITALLAGPLDYKPPMEVSRYGYEQTNVVPLTDPLRVEKAKEHTTQLDLLESSRKLFDTISIKSISQLYETPVATRTVGSSYASQASADAATLLSHTLKGGKLKDVDPVAVASILTEQAVKRLESGAEYNDSAKVVLSAYRAHKALNTVGELRGRVLGMLLNCLASDFMVEVVLFLLIEFITSDGCANTPIVKGEEFRNLLIRYTWDDDGLVSYLSETLYKLVSDGETNDGTGIPTQNTH